MNALANAKIAIASGKGGTGKTTVAVNLAFMLRDTGYKVRLLDCDVEAPNAHIFMKPEITESKTVSVPVPVVDEAKCNGCGRCGEVCRFSAIVALGTKAMPFSSLCHGCGSCILSCPERAISEGEREIGILEKGISDGVEFAHGRLRVGEAMSPPLIRAVKKLESDADVTIIDCPPGTSCPVVQSVRGSDYVALVTEPTPFGLNDLILAVEMIREVGLPFGVVVNRMGAGDQRTHDFCIENNIQIIGTIPDDRRIAESYSRGGLIFDDLPEYRERFDQIIKNVMKNIPARNNDESETIRHI